ncbi:alanine racemase [Halorhodospira halophila]|uniref:Alanine racemase n=1 Tax=Halorhodospira halophila (strain DSM 244 / SL1) TaxID=349124 RepID=ALR_HALHL|nr:alanine racemase [Halorhodospira halophila]A1WUS2.1 RecName: Full=Alanine racemase [Halorhodospira halophila SL1]ABM61434.1 alanine racemase [Halorhodospira halophila SL1]MBK1728681.1 alanine racemase [Halorhodospira halophila]
MSRAARATVNLSALRANLRTARAAAPQQRIMAVIKSDGYGHGLAVVAGALTGHAEAFAVTDADEAEALRAAGFRERIVLLQGPFAVDDLARAAAADLELVIHAHWQVEALAQAQLASPVTVWLKVDSGMHRLGFPPEEVQDAWRRLTEASCVRADIGFLTHLACADDRDDPATERQLETFQAACDGLPGPRSAANSAGVLGWPASHYDWVRPGIMLYGASPFVDGRDEQPALQPAMAFQGRVVAVRHLRAGDPVGYGATWSCPEAMPVGVVSIGYGDGYPRHAPSGTPVEVAGQRTRLVGRISMDMLAVDLRGLDPVAEGDPAILWGGAVRAEEVAGACGTIAYELFCRMPPRVRREPVDGETL